MADVQETTLIFIPGDGKESRTFTLAPRKVRLLKAGVVVAVVVALALVSSWVHFALRAAQVDGLQARILELEADQARTADLAQTLDDLEAKYEQIRGLFGAGAGGVESEVWLPPPAGTRGGGGSALEQTDPMPTLWPLTERGFVTQTLFDDVEAAAHPGLDIAVPADSYIRAAGAGTVAEAGEDPVYGWYIVLDHGNGYRTRYAHANLLLVEVGSEVRRREVIALSGSTGRSSAPHLHFELLFEGEAVDPLTLVQQPA